MNLQWSGFVLGLTTVLTIAIGHVLVRRLHARFGTRPAIPLFILGGLLLAGSTLASQDLLSAVLSITATTFLWDGVEIFRQEKRVRQSQS